ncbi:aminotransferase class IV [Microcella daejeonensis]|uniref:Aminotransferase class IV n=1 Tax=Microcella daejeonensis TaxID=2994971 RepID=A0A9E8SAV7_9MICO|nr:aminotransferase class IV [Microcella daejeonensis]WAB81007.1 aminotransferase class IV [Microcella daejeonensis]
MSTPQHLILVSHDQEGHATGLLPAEADAPQLSVLDASVTRGDGVFETISVGSGHPQALDAHLDRFARSARMLDLPEPDAGLWGDAVHAIAEALAGHEEAWVKTVISRGIEGGSTPTGWAYGSVSPDFRRERTEGVAVALLDRGLRSDVAETAPWLLAGAKTLSYAVNKAAVREAQRRGADDALFVSSDGLLLEGPTSTLIVLHDRALVTPPAALGILPGTTQHDLFSAARDWGLDARVDVLRPDDLRTAESAWLVSSLRLAAPIRAVDGAATPVDAGLTAAMNGFLRSRRS